MKELTAEIKEVYKLWSEDSFFDQETRTELLGIKDQVEEITERFYKKLEVGTGGLRGIIGAGTNRINIYTVSHITEGLARLIERQGSEAKNRGVCISYDSRNKSSIFALQTALCLASHGIKAYLFKRLNPTPILSFAVRYLGASAGVMITASHNPAKYNGYKMYGEDGGQMPPETANQVVTFMNEVKDIRELKFLSEAEAVEAGFLEYIGEEIEDAYQKVLENMCIDRQALKHAAEVKLVYTPLHGTGNLPVMRIFKNLGYTSASIVEAQAMPDGNFSTVSYPNPEDREALAMAILQAKEQEADLVLATDPDADRMGVALRQKNGEYQVLSGNQIGLLLLDYILAAKAKTNTLLPASFVATTIVSSRLVRKIAESYGIKYFEVLTGFKYIGELIKEYNDTGKLAYQFGFEESFGYLATAEVRDKDAVSACMLFAEMLIASKLKNENLSERLEKLYEKYGFGMEKTVSITLEGQAGINNIKQALEKLRYMKQLDLGEFKLRVSYDYQTREKKRYDTAGEIIEVEKIILPESNVLLYEIGELDWVCVRPSGTEPKLKIYAGAYASDKLECENKLKKQADIFEKLVRSLLI